MLTPIQNSPLPLEPVRQQITPQVPVQAPAPPPVAEVPVQASANPKDKFTPNDGGRNSGGRDSGEEQQQQSQIADQLRAAYEQLTQLQQAAAQALEAGDAQRAKEVAQQAAQVANTIQSTVGLIPNADFGAIAVAAQQQLQDSQSQSVSGGGTSLDVPAALDTARAGLGTAMSVVNSATSVPGQPTQNLTALDGMRRQVLDAMAGLEAVAARIVSVRTVSSGSGSTTHVNIVA